MESVHKILYKGVHKILYRECTQNIVWRRTQNIAWRRTQNIVWRPCKGVHKILYRGLIRVYTEYCTEVEKNKGGKGLEPHDFGPSSLLLSIIIGSAVQLRTSHNSDPSSVV